MTEPLAHLSSISPNAAASFAEAMELFSGRPTPAEVHKALQLLESSAAGGCSAAGERLATFHAMAANGPGGPGAWDRAFDALAAAAEQGSASAAAQLLLLADPAAEPAAPAQIEPGFWQKVRSEIDLDRLLPSPARKTVRDTPRIRLIEGFASPAECRWVMAAAKPHLAPATVFDQATGALIEDPARSNSAVSLMFGEMDVVCEILRSRIALATQVPVTALEPAQILRYQVGQAFLPHHDFLDAGKPGFRDELAGHGQRIATFLIYLNEEFEGGETAFPAIGLRFHGHSGDALFWANLDRQNHPDPLTLHAGLPPTAGEKWVFSQWIRERSSAPANG